ARQPVDTGQVLARVHGDDAGRRLGLARVDLPDLRVRVRRAQEMRVRVIGRIDVVGVLSRAGEETVVFLALDRRADDALLGGTHGGVLLAPPWRARVHGLHDV